MSVPDSPDPSRAGTDPERPGNADPPNAEARRLRIERLERILAVIESLKHALESGADR